jgi:putative thioredoxin
VSIDVTDTSFQADVIDRSAATPVVVDLWAPWCGPCRILGPILQKVVDETDGKVVLAKVNVDENPQVSQAFRVQGIPAVYAVADGKVVSGFVGAQPEAAVREFVDSLLPSEEDEKIAALLAAGDEASLRQVLDQQPDHHDAIVALAELLADQPEDGAGDEALALLGRIPETPETRRVAALVRTGAPALDAGGNGEEITAKLDALLDQVRADDEARQEYVDLLEVLGPDDPRTADYRKRLTRQLF